MGQRSVISKASFGPKRKNEYLCDLRRIPRNVSIWSSSCFLVFVFGLHLSLSWVPSFFPLPPSCSFVRIRHLLLVILLRCSLPGSSRPLSSTSYSSVPCAVPACTLRFLPINFHPLCGISPCSLRTSLSIPPRFFFYSLSRLIIHTLLRSSFPLLSCFAVSWPSSSVSLFCRPTSPFSGAPLPVVSHSGSSFLLGVVLLPYGFTPFSLPLYFHRRLVTSPHTITTLFFRSFIPRTSTSTIPRVSALFYHCWLTPLRTPLGVRGCIGPQGAMAAGHLLLLGDNCRHNCTPQYLGKLC